MGPSGSAAAAADPERAGASQGGLGARRSIRKRTLPMRLKLDKAVGRRCRVGAAKEVAGGEAAGHVSVRRGELGQEERSVEGHHLP